MVFADFDDDRRRSDLSNAFEHVERRGRDVVPVDSVANDAARR